jgi:Flp pilus assembly protein TadG
LREFITFVRGCISNGPRRLRDWRNASATRVEVSPDQSESGAALVEFTVLMPVFFLIVFGIIEFGMIFFLQNNMVNTAREMARNISVQGLTPAQAKTQSCPLLAGTGQQFSITVTDSCPAVQDVTVQITVPTDKASFFNYLGMFTGGTLKAAVTMRKELTCQVAGTTTTLNCP